MKIFLVIITICLFSLNALAAGRFTKIANDVTIYSEYYPNKKASFKGTIIFINGSGSDISDWKSNRTLFNCVRKAGSVFLYDRSGVGKSPPNFRLSYNNPLTAELVSSQLFRLLKIHDVKPPYLMVAHSYGAIFAGYFTLSHPDSVKGLLLIDPAPRDFNYAPAGLEQHANAIEEAKVKPSKYIYKKYGGAETEIIYILAGVNESKRSLANLGMIGNNIPITILSSLQMEQAHPIVEDWYESQKQWLNQNNQSKILQVDANHFIHLQKPELICHELVEILEEINSQ